MFRINRRGYYSSGVRFGPGKLRGVIKLLIIINISIWAFETLLNLEREFNYTFGLVPWLVWHKFYIWQPLTYMFLHGGLFHVLINMFVLWMFGTEIEEIWGSKRFLNYYLLTGIGSGVFTAIFTPSSQIPVVGASGAVYGILLAFALTFPNRMIYLYFFLPIQAKYFAILMGMIEFISTLQHSGGDISNITHLSGLIIGYLYLRKEDISYRLRNFIRIEKVGFPPKKQGRTIQRQPPERDPETEAELRRRVDEILDKISEIGYENLSDEEKETLYRASVYFSRKSKTDVD